MVDRDKVEGLIRHLYWEVDDRMVYEGIRSELGDFETFVGYILAYLDHRASPE